MALQPANERLEDHRQDCSEGQWEHDLADRSQSNGDGTLAPTLQTAPGLNFDVPLIIPGVAGSTSLTASATVASVARRLGWRWPTRCSNAWRR